jgi:hypothetical protein
MVRGGLFGCQNDAGSFTSLLSFPHGFTRNLRQIARPYEASVIERQDASGVEMLAAKEPLDLVVLEVV